jgi:hypothetical protein
MGNCCQTDRPHKKSLLSGIIYGLIPHTFCIAFFALSLIGAVGGAALTKKFLLIPHFFLFLTVLSLIFATLAAFLYLKKNNCCNSQGIKNKYKYLVTLYATTIITNILVAYIIIPTLAGGQTQRMGNQSNKLAVTNIEVQIPCPGHAPY